jgi:hypothetical protein
MAPSVANGKALAVRRLAPSIERISDQRFPLSPSEGERAGVRGRQFAWPYRRSKWGASSYHRAVDFALEDFVLEDFHFWATFDSSNAI